MRGVNLFADPPPAGDPDRLALEVGRVVQRLRTLSVERLGQSMPDGRTRARAALDLAQGLVDARAQVTGDEPRELPGVAAHATADVLAVVTADLVTALREAERRSDRVALVGQTCAHAVAEVEHLRRAI